MNDELKAYLIGFDDDGRSVRYAMFSAAFTAALQGILKKEPETKEYLRKLLTPPDNHTEAADEDN
jgi:hypothetical protein